MEGLVALRVRTARPGRLAAPTAAPESLHQRASSQWSTLCSSLLGAGWSRFLALLIDFRNIISREICMLSIAMLFVRRIHFGESSPTNSLLLFAVNIRCSHCYWSHPLWFDLFEILLCVALMEIETLDSRVSNSVFGLMATVRRSVNSVDWAKCCSRAFGLVASEADPIMTSCVCAVISD